jgi:hypothetical protein
MENIFWGLLTLLTLVVIFLIIRGFLLWYWKINYRVELLERIDNNLEYIARLLKAEAPSNINKLIDKTLDEDSQDEGASKPD